MDNIYIFESKVVLLSKDSAVLAMQMKLSTLSVVAHKAIEVIA